jgi:hypothetical protein
VTTLFARIDEPFAVRWADQLDAALSGALADALVETRDDADVAAPPAPSARHASGRGNDDSAWERSVVVRTRVMGMPAPVVHEDQLGIRCTRDAVLRGVVLGRYTRCDRTTAIADEERVSRVHALVFAARGALWVVDTASTCGTSLLRARVDGDGVVNTDVGEGRRIARLQQNARLFLAGIEAVLILEP